MDNRILVKVKHPAGDVAQELYAHNGRYLLLKDVLETPAGRELCHRAVVLVCDHGAVELHDVRRVDLLQNISLSVEIVDRKFIERFKLF